MSEKPPINKPDLRVINGGKGMTTEGVHTAEDEAIAMLLESRAPDFEFIEEKEKPEEPKPNDD